MKKANLTDALNFSAKGSTPPKNEVVREESQLDGKQTQPSREGKKSILTYIDPAGLRELKILSANEGRTQQELVTEAINDLLIKYGMKGLC